MRALLLVLAVGGCGGAEAPIAHHAAIVEAPAAICPAAPSAVPVPPAPRTFETVIAFGRETDARRQQTVSALETCRRSLEALARWVRDAQTSK